MSRNIHKALQIFFLTIIFLGSMAITECIFSQDHVVLPHFNLLKTTNKSLSSVFCINVTGLAIGDVVINAPVYLFQIEKTNYSLVMQHIRKEKPISKALVNATKEFWFPCLGYGNYVFVLNTLNYNTSIGSPLPYTYDCENFSVDIVFQGGDLSYAVGVFEIKQNIPSLKSSCKRDLIANLTRRKAKGLYKWCPYC